MRTDGSRRDELIVRVFADESLTSFTLYEDDGETTAYQLGEVRTTLLSQQKTPQRVSITLAASSGTYADAPSNRDNGIQLVEQDADKIQRVTLNGTSLPRYDSRAEYEAAVKGWYRVDENLVLAKSGKLAVASPKVFEFQFAKYIYLPVAFHQK
jgi:alpha-glucosidase